jgi:hypothetical protein
VVHPLLVCVFALISYECTGGNVGSTLGNLLKRASGQHVLGSPARCCADFGVLQSSHLTNVGRNTLTYLPTPGSVSGTPVGDSLESVGRVLAPVEIYLLSANTQFALKFTTVNSTDDLVPTAFWCPDISARDFSTRSSAAGTRFRPRSKAISPSKPALFGQTSLCLIARRSATFLRLPLAWPKSVSQPMAGFWRGHIRTLLRVHL